MAAKNVRPPRALVVDDEAPLATIIGNYLDREGFSIEIVHDGIKAVERAREVPPDLIILDLGLPGADGIEVCRQIRTFSQCYIIMVTARAEEVDTLIGLSVGADDYITKPFSPRELMARVRTVMRRPRMDATTNTELAIPGLRIDQGAREVFVEGIQIDLTRTEFDILATLAAKPELVFAREQIMASAWGPSWFGDAHVVDVHVGNLRTKLGEDPKAPRFIRTVRGVGYRMGPGNAHA